MIFIINWKKLKINNGFDAVSVKPGGAWGHRWEFVSESFKRSLFRKRGNIYAQGNSRPYVGIAHAAVHAGTRCVLRLRRETSRNHSEMGPSN